MNIVKTKVKKKRPSIWLDSTKPYGTYTGERGNPSQWKTFYEQAMGLKEANAILKDESPWGVLGIPEGSTLSIIKKAFRTLVMKVHPDYGGTSEAFNKVLASYRILNPS